MGLAKVAAIKEDRGIALYNAHKKEVIGLFCSLSLAGRYLFIGKYEKKPCHRIRYAAMSKSKIKDSMFGFPVAARYINTEQKEILGSLDYMILNGYNEPLLSQMKGFDSQRADFQKELNVSTEQLKQTSKRKKDI